MKNFSIILVLVSVLAVGCTENIDFDLNTEKSRLVVEGQVSSTSAKHFVKLTKTTSYYNNEAAPVVSGAQLSISNGDSTWNLIEERPGHYFMPEVNPDRLKTYTLTIDAEDQTYVGSDFLLEPVIADSIQIRKESKYDFEEQEERNFYSIHLYAQEPPGLGDAYIWKYWIKKPDTAWKDMTPRFLDWAWGDDEFIDGNRPKEGWEIFDYIEEKEFPIGTQVRVEMYHITQTHYKFLLAMGEQTDRRGFFDGPPANIPSNVSNGAVGFFSAVGVDTVRTFVRE